MSDEKKPAPNGKANEVPQAEPGAAAAPTVPDLDPNMPGSGSESASAPQASTPLRETVRETPVEPLTAPSQDQAPTGSAQNSAATAPENAAGEDAAAEHRRRNEEFLRQLLEDAERASDRKPK